MAIFHSYVKLPEGSNNTLPITGPAVPQHMFRERSRLNQLFANPLVNCYIAMENHQL